MQKEKPSFTLISTTLNNIMNRSTDGKSKLIAIMQEFKENSIAFTMLIFALPVAIPFPYPPGFTSLFGIPLIFFSIQMILKKKNVFLPKAIADFEISNSKIKIIASKMVSVVKFFEKYTTKNLYLKHENIWEIFIGLISLFASIAIAIPLPFTNAIPALGVSVMMIGFINKNEIIIIWGLVIVIIGIIIAYKFIGGIVFLFKMFY